MGTKNKNNCHSDPTDGRRSTAVRLSTKGRRKEDPSLSLRMTKNRFAGFTLAELIVVITILVILGTIAFLNLGNFSSGARDSGRVSDLTNISKGLDLMYVKNGVVLPPEAGTNMGVVNLYASGALIGQQWAIGNAVLSAIKMGGDGKYPVDKKSYTYLVNADRTKYQLLALAEDSSNAIGLNSLADQAYAGYESRYPMTKGASLGVLLGSTGSTLNQPIQENYSVSTFTGVELFTATGGLYQAVLSSKSILSGTGNALLPMVANLDTGAGYYPGCDTPNIRLPNGQIWAACNVGASRAYAGQSIVNCGNSATDCVANIRSTLGSYFQWGRNEDVTSIGTGSTLAATGTLANTVLGRFIINNTAPNDWIASQDSNLWWGNGTTPSWGTFFSQGSPASMQWPCWAWYHIPTAYEWWLAIGTINPSLTNTNSWQNDTSVTVSLKLPFAGLRSASDGTYSSHGANGIYWTSSPTTSDGRCINIDSRRIAPIQFANRAYGLSIRCLKN